MKITDIKLSPEFKSQTTKAIVSIILFVLTYLSILLLTVGLTALCIYGGIMLIANRPMFSTVALGIGLASFGALILIFLLKFLFKSHKIDRSHLYEVKRNDEPILFKLIDEIVNEVGTSFPKKVYLSTEVNAAVFYDSNFWSMFFPIQKNLQIGLGLVNTVTKTELKAILAHEFGHFSQRTMKVGSYVYNVNQVIFNMIYENDSYDKLIQKWSEVSGVFSIFVLLAVKIIEGIKWVLRKMYDVVNKSYMGLSREMEFHADEIAAHVTGYEPLKNSLLRMTLADHSFNSVLSFYQGKITDNLKSENVYKEQSFVLNFLAKEDNLPVINNLPEVTAEVLDKFNKSKLVIKDQWASHPSTPERIARLEATKIDSRNQDNGAAGELFANIEETQKSLTNQLFKDINYEIEAASIPMERFQIEYKQDFISNTFSKVYNGYYDNKNPIKFDIDQIELKEEKFGIKELFSEEQVELVYQSIALQNDKEILKQIADNTFQMKTFDYDGKKYKKKESRELLSKLEVEFEGLNEEIKQNDIRIFKFCHTKEQHLKSTSKLKMLYKEFFEFDERIEAKYELYTNLSNDLQFVNYTTPFEQITANFLKIEPLETKLKSEIKELMSDSRYQPEITNEIKENFELYLSQDWKYFGHEKYFDQNLEILFTAMNNYAFLLSRGYFLLKKELLDYQEGLIERQTPRQA